jgi:hypothetical protein
MAEVKFEDNSLEVKNALNDAVIAFLYEAGGEIVSQTQRRTPVDTGQLKGSWEYKVEESKGKVTIGSPLQNAIWNEFGTGQYALNGDGRKTPWKYQDTKGKWHTTTGKKPQRSLQHAWDFTKDKVKKRLEKVLKGL